MLPMTVLALVLAQPANPWLDEAKALASQLRFADALERLALAKTVPGLDAGQRHELVELTARCLVAEGRRPAAVDAFAGLLRDEPMWEPARDETPPKVLEAYDEAKRKVYPEGFVQLEVVPASAGHAALRLLDPWRQVKSLTAHLRRDEGAWNTAALTPDADGVATFEVVVRAGSHTDWYVDGLGAEGQVVAGVGTAESPRVVSALEVDVVPRTEPQPPTARHAVGWVALSLGIAALGVATGLDLAGWGLRQSARDRAKPPGDWADTALRADLDGANLLTWALGLFIGGGVGALTGLGLVAW